MREYYLDVIKNTVSDIIGHANEILLDIKEQGEECGMDELFYWETKIDRMEREAANLRWYCERAEGEIEDEEE